MRNPDNRMVPSPVGLLLTIVGTSVLTVGFFLFLESLKERPLDARGADEEVSVVGMTEEAAVAKLEEAGYMVEFEERIPSSSTAEGVVMVQILFSANGHPTMRLIVSSGEDRYELEEKQILYKLQEIKDEYLEDSGVHLEQSIDLQDLLTRNTLLHRACLPDGYGLDWVKVLVDHGADISLLNRYGQTARMLAEDEMRMANEDRREKLRKIAEFLKELEEKAEDEVSLRIEGEN